MPIVGGRDLLREAERGGYAVPGFNVSNLELALGVLDAAEARRAPVLLQFNPSNIEHFNGIDIATAYASRVWRMLLSSGRMEPSNIREVNPARTAARSAGTFGP